MDDFNLLNLPEHNLIQILDNLDTKSLLNTTEVCKTFADLFNSSRKLNGKICLVLNTKYLTRRRNQDTESNLEVLQRSKRQYKSVKGVRDYQFVPRKEKIHFIFEEVMEEVEEIHFTNGVFNYGLFDESTKLRKLRIDEYGTIGIDPFEHGGSLRSLLMNKPNLKTLHINGSRWSHHDSPNHRLPEIDFSALQLEDLKLFKIVMDSAVPVFLSQQSLKTVDLHLCWNGSMRVLEPLFRSKDLHTVKIGGVCHYNASLDESFSPDVICQNVVNFTIDCNCTHGSRGPFKVLKIFAPLFPNVKKFTLFDADSGIITQLSLSPWYQLESLTIWTKHEHLKELSIRSGNFKSLEYLALKRKIDEDFYINFGDFLARHQSIRQIKISEKYEVDSQRIERVIAESLPLIDKFEVLWYDGEFTDSEEESSESEGESSDSDEELSDSEEESPESDL